jgi:hypothetical protein
MESQSLLSLWRQRLIRGSCALTFVGSLALYHKTVLVSPVTLAQRRWEAIAATNRDRTRTQFDPNAIAPGTDAAFPQVFRVTPIYSWRWQWLNNTKFNSSQ